MVLKVLAYSGQMMDALYTEVAQPFSIANPGKLENLRAVNRTGTQDRFPANTGRSIFPALFRSSTPTKRRPSNRSRETSVRVNTVRLFRSDAGLRKAVDAEQRKPWRVVN